MQLGRETLLELCELAIDAALKAGKYISSYNQDQLKVEFKSSDEKDKPQGGTSIASQVFTEVDLKSQEIVLNELAYTKEKYNLGILTEEIADDKSRFEKEYFWCIDPLDGTLLFSEGLEGYSVSIALVAKNGTPVIGVVCNPVTMNIYHAIKGGGVFKNRKKWSNHENVIKAEFTFIIDRSFSEHKNFKKITTSLNNQIINLGYSALKMIKQGGAVMNAIWVLENQPGCYFKLPKKEKGGGCIWDFAATACIYDEYGAKATDIFGNKLDLNKKITTFMNNEGVLFSTENNIDYQKLFKPFI
jgi:3'-phosphoadenosine 5'-phosphosulfate (PAPS) 3'-phosphatase